MSSRRVGLSRMGSQGVARLRLLACATIVLLASAMPAFAQTQGAPAMPEAAVTTGQTISLDLKGVDILDVLKLLSQRSGMNFVAGRNVTGRVTIFAKDVDVWDAFEQIVQANDLAYERDGDLIKVMTANDYELLYGEKFKERRRSVVIPLKYAKANQLATVLNQLKSTLGQVMVDEASNTIIINDVPERLDDVKRLVIQLDRPTETRIYQLNYAEAEKLKEKLQDYLTPGIGTFSFDARTNKAVISDLQEVMAKLDQIVLAFDEQEGEVLIESKLVKVELTNDKSFGVDWQQVFGGIDAHARGNFRVLSDIVGGTATGTALKYIAGSGNAQAVIEALQKYGKVETVSNPRITVSNNQEAKILIGTKEAIVTVTTTVPTTGSVVTSPEVQFVDVGTKLFVTPNVKSDGHIQLKIRPEVSTAKIETFQTNRIPIVTTTEAETNVLVQSGTTLIIGGLIEKKIERTQSQFPILGDIPMVGAAFRSRVDTTRKSELVVFLTPQIIAPNGRQITDFPAKLATTVAPAKGEAAEPVPKSYQLTLRRILEGQLKKMFSDTSVAVAPIQVSFVLSPQGRLTGRPQVRSEQGAAFEERARQALETGEFPPFPEGSSQTDVQFQFTVNYKQE